MGPNRDRVTVVHAATACPSPAEQVAAIAEELGEFERLERTFASGPELRGGPEAQLRALAAGAPCGHPLLAAVVLAEWGRRAGAPVGIVAGAHGHFVAHQRLTRALVLDPAAGALVDASTLGVLEWRCGHQVAAELLDLLQPRYERAGDLGRALQVARLRCALPFDDMAEAELRLRGIIARLN
jgi:hypothetical protein